MTESREQVDVEAPMKTILLTQGQVALVDDDDYEMVVAFRWYAQWQPKAETFYAVRHAPRVNGKQTTILMHRSIMQPDSGFEIDHRNHDGLDNRRSNLRVATGGQNQGNQRPQLGRTSRFKGVYFDKRNQKWRAQIMVDGRKRHLGRFTDETNAARAYDAAALTHFGEFALVNFRQEEQD